MNGDWVDHGGDEMPCDGELTVTIQQRDGALDTAPANEFGWRHRLDMYGNAWDGDAVRWREAAASLKGMDIK